MKVVCRQGIKLLSFLFLFTMLDNACSFCCPCILYFHSGFTFNRNVFSTFCTFNRNFHSGLLFVRDELTSNIFRKTPHPSFFFTSFSPGIFHFLFRDVKIRHTGMTKFMLGYRTILWKHISYSNRVAKSFARDANLVSLPW